MKRESSGLDYVVNENERAKAGDNHEDNKPVISILILETS